MGRRATSLAIRKQGQTVIGVVVPTFTWEGTSIRSARDAIRRTSDSGITWVSVGTEGEASLLACFLQNLRIEHGDDLDALAVGMARIWLVDRAMHHLHAPVLLASMNRLLRVGPRGEVVEPSDGVVAIGPSSGLVMGAAKALLNHTAMDGERIVRESLQFAADGGVPAAGAMTVEVLP